MTDQRDDEAGQEPRQPQESVPPQQSVPPQTPWSQPQVQQWPGTHESVYGQAAPNQQQPAPAQQPWGQPAQPQQPANPYAYNPQQANPYAYNPPTSQPVQPTQPWGTQSAQGASGQPAQPSGGQPAPPMGSAPSSFGAPTQQSPWAQQGQQQWQGQPQGVPYGSPYGAPYGEVPQQKKSRAWLWILLAVLAVVGLMIFFAVRLLLSSVDTDALYSECEAGSASACEDLFRASDAGSDQEWFGQTCGGRTDGFVECSDPSVNMSVPANSYVEETDQGSAPEPSVESESGNEGTAVEPDSPMVPLAIDDPDGCMDTGCESGAAFGDNPRLDNLYTACESGNMEACDDLYWLSDWDSEYETMGFSCGQAPEDVTGDACSERDALWGNSQGYEFDDWDFDDDEG
ncbi:hypothetical protein SAMN06298212_11818 [Ruaniaceae bacterium KH17]|nr:hypothetical protein SAMN06298212_11818 [Ruaniaceae bacterium KH17]